MNVIYDGIHYETTGRRAQKAKCICGWQGKTTVDTTKSFRGHRRRVT
jgi:hypothetical protein